MYKVIMAIVSAAVVLVSLCVPAYAVTPRNAWLIESSHINNGNYTPNVYGSIEDSPLSEENTLEFLHRFQTSIEMMGFSINHWLGTFGSTSGVYGYSNFGWEGSGEGTLYWVVLLYTVNISYNGGPYKASNYGWDPDYSTEEVDSFTGVLDLGVATVEATAGIYRVTNDITSQGGAYATRLNVNYQSGTYASDGILWPIITPMFYEEQTDAEKALDDIKQGIDDLNENLMGTASHPAIDDMSNENAGVQSRADAVLDGLDVGQIEYSTPSPVIYDTNASGVLNWLFSIDFVWTFILTGCGLWLTKVILYGIG